MTTPVHYSEAKKHATTFQLNNTLSINTVIACITLLGGVLAITDRLAANAASTAVIQQKQATTDLTLAQILSQRAADRQEVLAELRFIREELREAANVARKK